MKKKLFLLTFLLSFTLFADDSVTYVPIGEADVIAEKLYINDADTKKSLKDSDQKLLETWVSTLRNDFAFYKHFFEVIPSSEKDAYGMVDFNKLNKKEVAYFIASEAELDGDDLQIKSKLYSIKTKQVLKTTATKVSISKIKSQAHEVANDLYKSITGKDSIFGTKIYFVSDRTSIGKEVKKELYVMDFDGANVKRLTYHNSIVISPAVSIDGSKVLYSVIQKRSATKVKNINLNMLDLKKGRAFSLSRREGMNSGAIFSHDAQEIYLTLSFSGNAEIYAMNLKTKKLRKITRHHADEVDPSINKEGDLMTFLSSRPGRAMIYTLDPRGTEKDVKRISFVGKFNAAPRFSPDGSEIVFSSWVDDRFDLYRIDSEGNNLVRLSKDFGSNEEASFSPDGEFIIFTSQRVLSQSKATQDIYIMTRDGEMVTKLSTKMGKCFSPRWSK